MEGTKAEGEGILKKEEAPESEAERTTEVSGTESPNGPGNREDGTGKEPKEDGKPKGKDGKPTGAKEADERNKRRIGSFLLRMAILIACGYLVNRFVFTFRVMNGESMYPRVRDGDVLLTYRLPEKRNIGDVMAFVKDGKAYVGRIVAQTGDVVDFDEDGRFIVNGNVQVEDVFYPTQPVDGSSVTFPMTVEEGRWFLLCDHRTEATDSRSLGTIRDDEFVGKVVTVVRRRGI